ncbi:hypothetical protein SLEP1_g47352 [Rubroshorea leprosula]|uniref:Condensin complex subunit 2 n=1 Tax=Rubroshorea leprosula TaxID=152421 RepID=A0AAV5LQ92_9ROSI|nr:hypothetical protein SLEP1_g47352 [Rubroshorea leprosula]
MDEAVSPRQRATMINRLQSPTTAFFLRSNDDRLERAQARAAARAAAIRPTAPVTNPPSPPSDYCLSKQQIIDLFQNCIKLASENKINQKNTWELKLIDHLSDIIKVDAAEADSQANFQRASCTLEASVKIYSVRVDAVHAEAYKVLSGINRIGQEDVHEMHSEGGNVNNSVEGSHTKRESEKKISPLSTLECSFEALNAKKFEVAFLADPLYQQTSAQFDEGGAKGLLLNNLGVYQGCRVLFDSFEVPGKCKSCSVQNKSLDMIDISFAEECIENMVMNMQTKNEISPTLRDIVLHFGKDNERLEQTFHVNQNFDILVDAFDEEADLGNNSIGDHEAWTSDHDEVSCVVNETSSFGPTFNNLHEENCSHASCEPNLQEEFEDVAAVLCQGFLLRNTWAGPDHWKYWKFKGSGDVPATESRSASTAKRPKNKNMMDVDIDFMKSLDNEMPDIFSPPKNPKSLMLPANRALFSNTLPEDCHYRPENLVKLFLLPNVLCLGKSRRKNADYGSWQQDNDLEEELPSWGNESGVSSQYNDGYIHDDVRDSYECVTQPHKVNKIEVQYDKNSKQVDVHALKETLWDHMQVSMEVSELGCKAMLSFKVSNMCWSHFPSIAKLL